jgi:hypothetical protein
MKFKYLSWSWHLALITFGPFLFVFLFSMLLVYIGNIDVPDPALFYGVFAACFVYWLVVNLFFGRRFETAKRRESEWP